MRSNLPYPVISADGHVNEPEELFARLPAALQARVAIGTRQVEGGAIVNLLGCELFMPDLHRELTPDELMREFRQDPSGGRDLDKRLALQAQDGVAAEVVFPNQFLALGAGGDTELNYALASVYNDFVHETFSPRPDRFVAAPIILVDDIIKAVSEAERCLKMGFRTLLLPCSNPWRPYDRPDYEPLWHLAEEAGVPLNFHVFTGNVFLGTDFASVEYMSPDDFSTREKSAGGVAERRERLSTTVIGMAAGMGPIVHLTGGGVLEKHPDLKFVVTEAECGWLAWALQAMDAMQERRRLGISELSMKPSEYFLRQGVVTISDDPVAINNLKFTGTDNIMWGNDYPHDEGTYPNSQRYRQDIVDAVSADEAYKLFIGNAARIYGFDENVIKAAA
ncbi:MAG: amidohydrolase family protein [Pseudomonadota bacterium]